MTATGRIRWERNDDGSHVTPAYEGYVGTIGEPLFFIFDPDDRDPWWILTSSLPGLPGAGRAERRAHGDDPDKLKAEAEQWLERFVSSLGAIFPEGAYEFPCCEHDLETAYAPGAYVRYQNPDAGWPGDQDKARELLTLGRIYGIAWSDIGQSKTSLGLVGIDGSFNSVLFEPVATPETPSKTAGTEN